MKLGLGCGALGDPAVVDDDAARALVRGALDLGVTVFDAARSYGLAEARLGRALAGNSAVKLSTKGGYGVEPIPEWTGAAVRAGIERACATLGVAQLEVFHLHSCPLHVLRRPELIDALHEARKEGRIVRAGYAGDGDALDFAVECGAFDAVEASFSLFDQANAATLRAARAKGLWVLAKRPLGGAVWRQAGNDAATRTYRERFETMALRVDLPWEEFAARFVAHAPEIDVMLVGTRSLSHLGAAAAAIDKGPLPDELVELARSTFAAHGAHWTAQV